MLFKKKTNEIKVMHYEGIEGFNQNYPCTIEEKENEFIFKKIKPELTVTLPKDKIKTIDYLLENEFMQKYHSTSVPNNKIFKSYFVINYISNNENKYIAFWCAGGEGKKLIDIKKNFQPKTKDYTL